MPVFETDDDRRRRLRSLGVLADGERMHIGMLLTDSAAPAGAHQKDAAMNINDTLRRLPSDFRSKIRHAIGYMNDANPNVAQNGITNASNLRQCMAMARGDFGGGGGMGGMVTDAEKSDITKAIDYLDGVVMATRQRLASRGR